MDSVCGPPSAFPSAKGENARWARWAHRLEAALPLALLVVATVLSVTNPEHTPARQWEIAGLAAAASAVVLLTDTLPPSRWRNPWTRAFAFVALLGCATVLTLEDVAFTVFMVAAFFRAMTLTPRPMMVLGLLAASALIHSLPSGGPLVVLEQWPSFYLILVVVQTVAIGGGFVLSQRLVQQSEQRRALLLELQQAMDENAGLHRQLLVQAREAGVLDERQRLSHEIHDTLAQGLAGIITQLTAARRAETPAAEWERRLDLATTLARENLQQARRAVQALGPGELDGTGLRDALAGVITRWGQRAGLDTHFSTTGDVRALHPEIEASLLRVTQEALANIAKHANANRAVVTLSYLPDQVALDILDDGIGFAPPDGATARESTSGGYGLPGMRHRLQRMAGSLVIESEPGAGTAICATVPAITAAAAS